MIIIAIGGVFIGMGRLFTREGPMPAGPMPTAELWTATPTFTPTATPQPTATPILPTPTASTAEIGVGMRVRVSGTGGIGLSLRTDPGLNFERVDIVAEGATFIVAGGPTTADELTWWLLKDENDPQREGWAAANYLQKE